MLARNQKTRGRFYLFLLYEVNRGLVHWTFYPGKGAVYVCRFLRRVRRWYPRQPVRIALDRDPAHPIKAQVTRSLMRRLRLNWTSMPKRSPDDNPAETIFSDIQQNILDNSDDPDERTTRRRISRHLRARNRRPDRFVRIGYLRNTRYLSIMAAARRRRGAARIAGNPLISFQSIEMSDSRPFREPPSSLVRQSVH